MLIGGVLGYVFREKLLGTVDREMRSSIRLYDHRRSIRDAWDATQSTVSNFREIFIVLHRARCCLRGVEFNYDLKSPEANLTLDRNDFSSTAAALTAGGTGESSA